MTTQIQVFEHEQFGKIRTSVVGGEPWFVAKDVCRILGINDPNQSCRGFDDDEKGLFTIQTPGGEQRVVHVSESGFYRLIMRSRKPEAKAFQRWVTHDVLPAIRRTGGYMVDVPNETPEQTMARALLIARDTMERQKARIAELGAENDAMRPKALFADAVAASRTSILVGDLAKLIKQNGVDIGQRRLFDWMRERGWLMKGGASRNMPTQKSMDMGLFEVKERTVTNPDGSSRITRTPKVTGKGQQYFVNLFLSGKSA